MELKNTFEVAATRKSSWDFLLDPERVTPCIPGAELVRIDDDGTWHVKAKVKLGPVTMNYKGKVNIVEKDEGAFRVVMKGSGTETKGKGTVKADIVSELHETDGGGTRAEITSTVKIAGKAAQFGRGMIGDVAGRFTQEFAEAMEHALAEDASSEAAEAAEKAAEAAKKAADEAKKALEQQKREEAEAEAAEKEAEAKAAKASEAKAPAKDAAAKSEVNDETLTELRDLLERGEKAAKKAESAARRAEAEAKRAEAEAARADAACKRAEAAAKKMELLAKERKETKEVSGFGIAFWAIGRAISRFFRGIFGGGDKELPEGRK